MTELFDQDATEEFVPAFVFDEPAHQAVPLLWWEPQDEGCLITAVRLVMFMVGVIFVAAAAFAIGAYWFVDLVKGLG